MTGPHPSLAASGVRAATAQGIVVDLPGSPPHRNRHEPATREWIARHAASLLGYRYAGSGKVTPPPGAPVYYVPQSTLLSAQAAELGITGDQDLLGGVVPHAFVASKVVSHPLIDGTRVVPTGWSRELGASLAPVVLPGYSAFGRDDARDAGRALLRDHPAIRIKPGAGIGGLHQTVVTEPGELDAAIDALDGDGLRELGVVLELNLDGVATYSVGTIRIAGQSIAYLGVQRLTRNHKDAEVYGGSDLACVRGGAAELREATPDPEQRQIVEMAIRYDEAISAAYPGLIASRRNYDIATGRFPDGTLRHGVLEQSWRIGGATPAEICALLAFAGDSSLQWIRTSTHEVYDLGEPPPGAEVYFRDVDPVVGTLTKYSRVDRDGRDA